MRSKETVRTRTVSSIMPQNYNHELKLFYSGFYFAPFKCGMISFALLQSQESPGGGANDLSPLFSLNYQFKCN